MVRSHRLVLVLALLSACSGDDAESAGSSTSTGTTGAPTTSGGTSTTSGASTTTGTATESGTTAGSASSGTESDTSTGTSDGTTTGGIGCEGLPAGPFTPEVVTDVFGGSEDLAFDGLGYLAAKAGDAVLLVDAALSPTTLATPVPKAYGLRFMVGGDLAVALPDDGKILRITRLGVITDLATGLGGPNGLFPGLDGSLWVTEFAGARVSRIRPDLTTEIIVQGAEATAANGIVHDIVRQRLFFTNYASGRIASVDVPEGGTPGTPIEVVTLQGRPDGLALDACGHLYAVDQQNSRLYRIWLDPAGVALGEPELLADHPTNVANAQFGRGVGFDPLSIYTAGNPGVIYRIPVGVAGAAIP